MNRSPLTPKQARFVEEYSLDHNGAAAAVRAGYAPGSARVTASRLLSKDNVRTAVAALEAEAAKALQITREDVLAALLEAYNDARKQKNPGVMVGAARAVGAICGFFQPERHVVTITPTPGMMARFEIRKPSCCGGRSSSARSPWPT
jgi:Terminase small subunit